MNQPGVEWQQAAAVFQKHHSLLRGLTRKLSVRGGGHRCRNCSSGRVVENAKLEHGHKNSADHIVELPHGDSIGLDGVLKWSSKPRVIWHFQIEAIINGE